MTSAEQPWPRSSVEAFLRHSPLEISLDVFHAQEPELSDTARLEQRNTRMILMTHEEGTYQPPWDVRVLPLVFRATYWLGVAIMYAFMSYIIARSASWRGPMLLWALLMPTVLFSLWRHLPSEKRLVQREAEVVVRLRCGGFYELGRRQSLLEVPDEVHEMQQGVV